MKKRLKFLIVLSLSFYSHLDSLIAQGVIEWQNTIGGNNSDRLYDIEQTADGGYILGGFSNSDISVDKTENTNGFGDYWILKTDSFGNIQWQNTIGGNSGDELYSIRQTSDNGYILGGYSHSGNSGDKNENNSGVSDIWILKTDSLGNIQWQNTIGGSSGDFLNSIQQTADGGFILGGFSDSNISGDKSENCLGGYDIWIVKTNSSGSIQWQNTIGGNGLDYLYSIQQTIDGGFILGGYSSSGISGDKTENCKGGFDYWIVKTDSTGSIQWQNTIGGNLTDILRSIQQTSDGGYILGGFSASGISGDKTQDNFGLADYWIVKTDSLGNIQWQNTIGGNMEDWLLSIRQTVDGGYILGGYSGSGISGNKSENNFGLYDYWIVKTDTTGNIQWQNCFGGNGSEYFWSLQQTADEKYILGGFSGSDISGDKKEVNNGEDFWIIKLTENYSELTGKLFIDANSNFLIDSGESVLAHKRVTVSGGTFTVSDHAGDFSIAVFDTGNYSISAASINYYHVVPSSHNAYFPGMLLTDSLNDFAYQPSGVFNDVCVTLTPVGPFRNGFDAQYQIYYENVGTTTLSGSVIFFPDSGITFVSSVPAPVSVSSDSVIWNYNSLAPYQSGSILVTVNINAALPIGHFVISSARIDPIAGDANPGCNHDFVEQVIQGAFDPNDILVDEDTLWTTQFPNPPFLDYIIRFQNTGNDTAFNVKILNPIDTSKLDLTSLEFLASSHPVNMNWLAWERNMEFKFNNILLADSNTNEQASHGFVRYRIKPQSNLSAGDSITNNAAIYFDFNAPVITNTAVTEVLLPTGIAESTVQKSQLKVYPNPATENITVTGYKFHPGENTVLRMYDVLGNEIFTTTLTAGSYKLATSGLPEGFYLLKVGNAFTRFVKQQ